jgi:hypothetical protein
MYSPTRQRKKHMLLVCALCIHTRAANANVTVNVNVHEVVCQHGAMCDVMYPHGADAALPKSCAAACMSLGHGGVQVCREHRVVWWVVGRCTVGASKRCVVSHLEVPCLWLCPCHLQPTCFLRHPARFKFRGAAAGELQSTPQSTAPIGMALALAHHTTPQKQ